MADEITIREAESPADYQACQQAQRQAWGIADQGYIVVIQDVRGRGSSEEGRQGHMRTTGVATPGLLGDHFKLLSCGFAGGH